MHYFCKPVRETVWKEPRKRFQDNIFTAKDIFLPLSFVRSLNTFHHVDAGERLAARAVWGFTCRLLLSDGSFVTSLDRV